MQYFAAPLQAGQQTTPSLRASQYKRLRKRKRDEDNEEEEEPPNNYSDSPVLSPNTQLGSSFAGADASQHRVAGLLSEDELEVTAPPFPHAPARTRKDNFKYSELQQELAGLDPPLYAVHVQSKSQPLDRQSEQPALRQTHLQILTTILHHCLLQGDYHRAGRAWGMMLRTQVAGRPIDLRSHSRWGIGAELLLHRNTHSRNTRTFQNETGNQPSSYGEDLFTPEGFEKARFYYERLIVQYPNRKQHPNSIDELTFYPAMFSLWIYEVCERSKHAQKEIRNVELQQAREISARLDQLITSPPFDKRAELLQLRGMLCLWEADLIEGATKKDYDSWDKSEAQQGDAVPDMMKTGCYVGSRAELQKAHVYFVRARENGSNTSKAIRDTDARIRELTKKIEGLGG
ncbi:hypothetical protein GQ43DRAFT_371203 [Delitschia confertaspora ATCC 74209]|uniref:Uncharacterized protein n=1 Tax=Delitschia confertaspora ATCC 74209 TaxID=1513339 RepID=A0A9P4MT03_9PLEO|nr:hypothetical protein GQ43DRAFT_371203 [Delitschia confertaspora ATCC 74209]